MTDSVIEYWQGQKGISRLFPPGGEMPDERIAGIPDYCLSSCCDVGCGAGRLAPFFHAKQYIGVDINPDAINAAHVALPAYQFHTIAPDDKYPVAESYLFHTVLLHVPDHCLDVTIQKCCKGKQIIVVESMSREFRDGVYNFQRDPDEYDVAFERCGYQLAHARRFEMESAPGFWDLRGYSVAVNVPSLYGEDYYKKRSQRDQILREDQLAALEYLFNDFSPALVVSVGCGEGLLEQEIERRGASVAGIDPGGGRYLGKNKIAELFSQERHGELLAEADALVFCEAIEHVPLKSLQEVLPKFKGRLVVTNIKDYHPIRPNNIDHITRIDDWVYDWISEFGEVRIRDGSHLVVEMKGEQQ